MDKRVLLAFLISILILGVYWSFFPPPGPKKSPSQASIPATDNQSTTVDNVLDPANNGTNVNQSDIELDTTSSPNAKSEKILLETETYRVAFNTQGAAIESLELKKHKYEIENTEIIYKKLWNLITNNKTVKAPLDESRLVNMIDENSKKALASTKFTIDGLSGIYSASDITNENGKTIITFSYTTQKAVTIVKRYEFDTKGYQFNLSIAVKNNSNADVLIDPKLNIGSGNEIIDSAYNPTPKVVMSLIDGEYSKYKDLEDQFSLNNFRWLAISDVYFVTGIKPDTQNWTGNLTPVAEFINNKKVYASNLTLDGQNLVLKPDQVWSENFNIYMGDKDMAQLKKFDADFTETLDLFFNIIARPMIHALRWFYSIANNWGIAIMLLTVSVRLIIFPIAFKGMQSMKNMSKLGPKMKALRKKYANDKQKLNTETMQLYRKNKINPLSGCLPLLMQIPIFIALYWALLPAVEIRHQPFFLWLNDLSHSDPYMILPLLMGVTMYIQQKVSPSPAGLDPIQVKIMRILPLFMTLLFVNFPAGLVLYWVTSNIISIGQQLIFNRIKTKEIVD